MCGDHMTLDDQLEQRDGLWWPAADRGCWDWMHMAAGLPDRVMRQVSQWRSVVVAGANAGFYVAAYASRFGQVLAIEPHPLNFHALVRNCQQANVVKVQAALGIDREPVSMRVDHDGNCGGYYCQPGGLIPTIRLDDFAAPVDCLHLDVEGYELQALQGAEVTVSVHRPAVVVETIGNETRYGHTAADVHAWFLAHGYAVAERLPHDTIYTWGGS
jgi:FkbM family methyltransferase